MEYITISARATQKLAGEILKELANRQTPGALVLALEGELGAGKTAFTQGLGEALGIKEKILSPTFVLMKNYDIKTLRLAPLAQGIKKMYHLDAYRLSGTSDAKELGLEEILQDKKNLVVVEWAERISGILPTDTVWLEFKHKGGDKRRIRIINYQ